MQINDHQNFAILGNNVTGFTLANSIVNGANGTNDLIDEASVLFTGLFGTASISNSTIRGGVEDNLRVINTSGTLNSLAITGSTFRDNHITTGNDGVFIGARNNAIMTVSITGGTFTANRGDHFQADAANNSQLTVTFSGNTLTGGHPNALGQTVQLTVDHSALITFNIANNNINGAILTAIQLFQSNLTTAGTRLSGQVSDNTIGTAGVAGSGSAQGNGLGVTVTGLGTATIAVTGNTIRQWSNLNGMQFTIGDTSAVLNATVTGNTLKEPNVASFPGDGMYLNAGTTAAGAASVCFDFGGAGALRNDIVGSGNAAGGSSDFRVRQRNSSTVRLPGYGGAAGRYGGRHQLHPGPEHGARQRYGYGASPPWRRLHRRRSVHATDVAGSPSRSRGGEYCARAAGGRSRKCGGVRRSAHAGGDTASVGGNHEPGPLTRPPSRHSRTRLRSLRRRRPTRSTCPSASCRQANRSPSCSTP